VSKFSGIKAAAVISEIIATGPFCNWREEPKSAATMGTRKAAYSPICGGSPANWALAID